MKLLQSAIANLVFALHVLLVFLLIFEPYVSLPIWLQPVGRMHPLLLHFPIGLLVLVGLMEFIKGEVNAQAFATLRSFVLHIAVISAAFSALMGFFLAQEDGYAASQLAFHKWTGVGVSFLAYALLLISQSAKLPAWSYRATLVSCLLCLVVAGHLGATLTHGENYVLAPLMKQEERQITPESPLFEAAVRPILEEKCQGCHNDRKQKGELNMSSLALMLEGGEHGPLWVPGDAQNSQMVQRISLPMEDEAHMPPEGKPQLTEEERALLEAWVAQGADVEKPLKAYLPQEPLYHFASNYLEPAEPSRPAYDFPAADEATVEALNHPFCTVRPLAYQSPALFAQLFVRQMYTPEDLEALLEIREQLVELNLTDMPITDESLNTLAKFEQLEELILNGTDITGSKLSALESCRSLKSLALSNTQVDAEALRAALPSLSGLRSLYLWNTEVDTTEAARLRKDFPELNLVLGYVPTEEEILHLSPPMLVNEKQILAAGEKITLQHHFPGVDIRYTLDGQDPDSLEAMVYQAPIEMASNQTLKARAFKAGWIGSEVAEFTLFKEGVSPEEVRLITAPNQKYRGRGATSLTDGVKGEARNFRFPAWLGYREQPLEALFDFGDQPPSIQRLTLSYAQHVNQYIMPPAGVELWGGPQEDQLQPLVRERYAPLKEYSPPMIKALDVELPQAANHRYYKLVVKPIRRLPAWHGGSGDPGWAFVDEVFFYPGGP